VEEGNNGEATQAYFDRTKGYIEGNVTFSEKYQKAWTGCYLIGLMSRPMTEDC